MSSVSAPLDLIPTVACETNLWNRALKIRASQDYKQSLMRPLEFSSAYFIFSLRNSNLPFILKAFFIHRYSIKHFSAKYPMIKMLPALIKRNAYFT